LATSPLASEEERLEERLEERIEARASAGREYNKDSLA
jgi:hypothetical protein